MILIQNLLRANTVPWNQAVQKTFNKLDVKYVMYYCKNCVSTFGSTRTIDILPSKSFRVNATKNLSTFRNTSVKAENKIRIRDGIPNNYNLIYRAPMVTYCKVAYPMALISAVFTPVFVYVKFFLLESPIFEGELGPSILLRDNSDLIAFTLGSFIIGCAILLFIFKFPFRIFHNPSKNDYIVVSLSAIPFKTVNMHFKSAFKVSPQKITLNLFSNSVYQLGSKKLLLIEEHFRRPIDLERMLNSNNS